MSETKKTGALLGMDKETVMHWGLRILFFLFAWLYLSIAKEDYLFKLQESNYFLYDHLFLNGLIASKSGVIVLCARFLLQFCYHPFLGAAIIALLLSGIEILASKIFRIGKQWFAIGFIPSAILLYLFNSISYEFYDSFEISYGICNILGFYYVLLLYVVYRKLKDSLVGVAILTIVSALTSIWMGPYPMVAILMFAADALFRKKYLSAGIILPLGVAGIYLFARYAAYHVTPGYFSYSLLHPWPIDFFFPLFLKTIIAHALIAVVLTSHQLYSGRTIQKAQPYINLALGILLIIGVSFGSQYPKTFKDELRLQHLAHQGKWKQMVKEMGKMEVTTRVIAAYRAVALIATDQLNEKIFNYDYNYYHTDFNQYCEEMSYYPELTLFGSLPQVSYRWCMEFHTDTSKKHYLLQIMAICSFINEEYELAKKYLNLLNETQYYKKWAKEMLGCLDDPNEYYKKYPYLVRIKAGIPTMERSGIFNGITTAYDRYTALPNITANKRLLTRLYRRQLDELERETLRSPMMRDRRLPRCVQEGLVMKALLSNDLKRLQRFPIEKDVFQYVRDFKEYYVQHYGENDLDKKMKKRFGYSYSYYFSFGIGSNIKNEKK